MTPEEFFTGKELSKKLFDLVCQEVESFGHVDVRVTKSQIALRRNRAFAWLWMPGQYLKGKTAPLVLTLSLPCRDRSNRWKEIVKPRPGRFTHHLELKEPADIDAEVRVWLRQAWDAASGSP